MALSSVSLTDIINNIVSDFEAEYGQTIPILKKAFFRIWARIHAGYFLILYKYGTDAYKQRFVQTAHATYLELLGEQVGVYRDTATAWKGSGTVECTGGDQIDAGTQAINTATGVVYTVRVNTEIETPTMTIALQASESGESGNLNAGDVLSFVSPPSGVGKTITITETTTEAKDKQDLEDYRQDVLDRYRKQPQGGALSDYKTWAKDADHITNAYPYTGSTAGTVVVYVEADDQTDGIPTDDECDAALEAITYDPDTGKATRRPATAEVTVEAITRTGIICSIVGLDPVTSGVKEKIETAVNSLVEAKEPYIKGVSTERNDTLTDSEVTAEVYSIVSTAEGTINDVQLFEDGLIFDLRTLGEGEKLKVESFSYT